MLRALSTTWYLPCESPSRKEVYSVISVLCEGKLRFGQENNLPEDTLLARGASWELGPGAKVDFFSPCCCSGIEGLCQALSHPPHVDYLL